MQVPRRKQARMLVAQLTQQLLEIRRTETLGHSPPSRAACLASGRRGRRYASVSGGGLQVHLTKLRDQMILTYLTASSFALSQGGLPTIHAHGHNPNAVAAKTSGKHATGSRAKSIGVPAALRPSGAVQKRVAAKRHTFGGSGTAAAQGLISCRSNASAGTKLKRVLQPRKVRSVQLSMRTEPGPV